MIISMTGYGRFETVQEETKLLIEMKSVNHRFCEVSFRLPRTLMVFEDKLRKIIQEKVHRGRIDVFITLQSENLSKKELKVDWELVQAYIDSSRRIQQEWGLTGEITVKDLIGIQDLFHIEEAETDAEQIQQLLTHAIQKATEQLVHMRIEEGKALAHDLQQRVALIEETIQQLKVHAPKVVEQYRNRLEVRLKEFLEEKAEIEESRLLPEVAIFSERSNISEEITRLESHCQQFRYNLTSKEPVGRKLDFLVQEMNREVNTIGSKANDLLISQLVVELKSNVEKIKEQVQNIE